MKVLPVSARHFLSVRGMEIAVGFMQRARRSSSYQVVLKDMVDSMAAAFSPTIPRVAFYHMDPFGLLHFDRANTGDMQSHVNGARPEGPLASVIERRGFLYVSDIINPPPFCDLLDLSGEEMRFGQIPYNLDPVITGGYIQSYGAPYSSGKRNMDMIFGCLSVPGEEHRPDQILGVIRADNFPSGRSLLPKGVSSPILLETFAILGNIAAQSLDELKTRTELYRERQDARALAVKALELLRRLKHDASGGLTVPVGYLKIVLKRMGDDPGALAVCRQFLERALTALVSLAPRLDMLVNQVKGGRFDLEVAPTHANLREMLGELSVVHTVNIADDIPEEIITDTSLVRHVVFGLVENARKYSSPDAPVVIEMRRMKDEIQISITDQGKGLSAEEMGKIFEGGYRADQSVSGTGYGLYGSKRIAESLGGCLWAESDGPGEGSTFYFTLPLLRWTT